MINNKYEYAHQLCFLIHDVMVDFLKTGEDNDIFNTIIELSDIEKKELLEYQGNILDWLKQKNKNRDYEVVVKKQSFKLYYLICCIVFMNL